MKQKYLETNNFLFNFKLFAVRQPKKFQSKIIKSKMCIYNETEPLNLDLGEIISCI